MATIKTTRVISDHILVVKKIRTTRKRNHRIRHSKFKKSKNVRIRSQFRTTKMRTLNHHNFSPMQEIGSIKMNRPRKRDRTILISCRPKWTKNNRLSNSCLIGPTYLQLSCLRYPTKCEQTPIKTIAASLWRHGLFRTWSRHISIWPRKISPIWFQKPLWHSL